MNKDDAKTVRKITRGQTVCGTHNTLLVSRLYMCPQKIQNFCVRFRYLETINKCD